MTLDIRFADFNKEIGKWVFVYYLITDWGMRYSQKIEFVNKEKMLKYKQSLQKYVNEINQPSL
jgi:hypothetical protein